MNFIKNVSLIITLFAAQLNGVIVSHKSTVKPPDLYPEPISVEATAYHDSNGYGHGADGRTLVEGLTLAGKPEWLGMSAVLYDADMNYIGTYEFRDTGYGQSTGRGQSKILKGCNVGTIENGSCIDIYFTSYTKCKEWGRRKVYMQLVKATG